MELRNKKSGKVYSYKAVYFDNKRQELYNALFKAGLTNLTFIEFVHTSYDDSIVRARVKGVSKVIARADAPPRSAQALTPANGEDDDTEQVNGGDDDED